VLLLFTAICAKAATPVHTDPLNNDPLVRDAFNHYYNLDYDGAMARFEEVRAAHPNDPIATAYLLNCVLFHELYRLDLLDTTFYANDGFLSGKHPITEDPKVRDQIYTLADMAIAQADAQYTAHPDDLDALFVRGWVHSLKAVYLAMVEREYIGSLRLAFAAHSDHQHVLDKDPDYVDAKLVVGVYQYVVGSLSFGFKVVVGFAGIGGSKSRGLELMHDAAARGVISSIEARTCLAFFLRREAQYKQAVAIVRTQVKEYPHNFLFALEEANLLKDDGQGPAAIAAYRRIINDAQDSRYYIDAQSELVYFGLGESLRGQKMYSDAVAAYEHASNLPTTSPELKRRSLLAAGQVYDLMHEHDKARGEYLAVLAAGPDTSQADLARKYMRNAYTP
jgi:tetratricopeptide (TPR) repeat protein